MTSTPATPTTPQADLVEGSSLWKDAFKRLRKNGAALAGGSIVLLMAICALGYEVIVSNITGFEQQEQHAYVVPKPPGSRSVPAKHFSLLAPEGALAFAALDADQSGTLDDKEVQRAYRGIEFREIDTNADGFLDFPEYEASPLTLPPPGGTVPDCKVWSRIKRSMAAIDAPEVFACDAENGRLAMDKAGRMLDIVSMGEASDIIGRFDKDADAMLSPAEYQGLPAPRTNWLGTDQLGRDLLSRLVYGARVSLAVGLLATLVSFWIGVIYGATAGFVGGKVDDLMMRGVDILYGLPFMFLVILLMVVFGQNILLLFLALGAVQWLTMARIVRGQVISLKKQEFVEAARTIGVSNIAIILRHLIPNALGPIIVYATLTVPAVMLEEAFLSFIGLGVQAPHTSWGALASEGRQLMETAPWLIIYPGLALAVTLLSLNFLGDGLRDALDPQLRKD